jgi:hypothetical protein
MTMSQVNSVVESVSLSGATFKFLKIIFEPSFKPLPYYFFQFPFRGYFFLSEPKVNDIKHPVKKSFSDNILIDTEI